MPKDDLCGKLRIRALFFAENEGSFGNPLTNRSFSLFSGNSGRLVEIRARGRYARRGYARGRYNGRIGEKLNFQ
jgi:hypothetical protein